MIEPTPEIIKKLERQLKERDGQIALLNANLREIITEHATFRDFVDSQSRHVRKLIINYGKRLQVLEVQQALKGLEAPPSLIIEIQEIRTELEQLYKQAKESETRTDSLVDRMTGGNGFGLDQGGA